jgi:pentalenolactone synthase
MAATESLPALPFERPSVFDPPPMLLRLQSERPVGRVRTPAGDVGWLVTGYEDVRQLLGDDRLGRAHPDPEHAPRYSGSMFGGGPIGSYETERADHSRMRRLLTRSFMVKRMNALRPAVQRLVDELLERMAAGQPPADLHQALSMPLPVLVICELLGVPAADRDDFRRWSDEAVSNWDAERALAGYAALFEYMRGHTARQRAERGDNVISELITSSEQEGDGLTDDDVAELGAGLLFAGHETTMGRLDFGVLLLLANPEQRRRLERDPAIVDTAVEEILRMGLPDHGVMARYARADLEVGGASIRAGDLVLLGMAAANRDDGAFDEPDRFDVGRRPNPHVTFGHGNHFCLGAGLARVELQIGLGTLFRRLPALELAVPVEELRLRDDLLTGGLAELPVAW